MTHDEITARLRDPRPVMSIDAQTTMIDAADRIDLYREMLRRCAWSLPATERFRALHRDIAEALR